MSKAEKAGRIAAVIWVIVMIWLLISWVDIISHNVTSDGIVHFWKYNAICMLVELLG